MGRVPLDFMLYTVSLAGVKRRRRVRLLDNNYRFTIEKIVRHGADKAALTLRASVPFFYKAGQYVELAFSDDLPTRPYSIAVAPDASRQDIIEIHIKEGGYGSVSHHAVHNAKVGDVLSGRGPFGSCFYEPGLGEIVLLAGGMGITPMKAMVEAAMAGNHGHPVHLHWTAKDQDDFYLDDSFSTLKNKYNSLFYNTIIEPLFTIDAMSFIRPFSKNATYYLSGPAPMVELAARELLVAGVPSSHLKADMVVLLQKIIENHNKSIV